ncbi:HEXXH motif-containing putative peptide modification protein [Myxococcus stipitatus]|uniref:aKG-HExxH-type peptide beta-hydroxylase n=1 Tax=Myxococcus stipitatus TaxID=83455 RepID=UPI0031454260
MQLIDAIRQVDGQLQQHEQFGDSSRIVGRVIERYKFALEVLARSNPRLQALASRVELLDVRSVDMLLGDLLVRAELEAAVSRIESSGPSGAESEKLASLLEDALGPTPRERGPGLARRGMERELIVGPSARTWVWDLPDASTPLADTLRESIQKGFMPGAQSSVNILRPTPRGVQGLERACTLLHRLVPHMADSIFRHLHSIAVAHIRGARGRMLTGSGGDGTPCMIFIDPDELENPWDTAGHILHEGIHLKLSDLIRTGAIVTDDEPVDLPWGRRTALSNTLFAFHAYVHMHVFRAAVEHLGPACHAEFGAPRDYQAPAHAMSVVNNETAVPYSRAEERLDFLHAQLSGPLSPRLTPHGRQLVAWLWDTLRPFERASTGPIESVAAPPRAPPSSARYRKGTHLSLRRSPSSEALFALDPRTQRIVTLNLAAWLAFELCEDKTEEEMLSAYTASLGLGTERGWAQLAPTLEGLVASGMVERLPQAARASGGASR